MSHLFKGESCDRVTNIYNIHTKFNALDLKLDMKLVKIFSLKYRHTYRRTHS